MRMAQVLIVIPAWNEAVVIEKNLRLLHAACSRLLHAHAWRLLVADNGSTDNTREIVLRMEEELDRIDLMTVAERGKGNAIREAWMREADAFDIFLFCDADLSADPEDLPALLSPLLSEKVDLAIGSRFETGAVVERQPLRSFLSVAYRLW